MNSASESAFAAFANTVYDTASLNRIIDDLTLIQRSLFKDKTGPISVKARDYTTSNIIPIFEEVEKAGLEGTTDQKQLQFLKDLVSFLQNLPIVKVTIAFDPTQSLIVKLSNQLSGFVGNKVILDLVIDGSVIGGAIFEYRGRRAGQTLQDKLEGELKELITRVIADKV